MALSFIDYTGNSSTTMWTVPFPFLSRDDVSVIDLADNSAITFSWINDSQILISPAVSSLVTMRVIRNTGISARVVDFQDGSILGEESLDSSANQNFYVAQEAQDAVDDKLGTTGTVFDAESKRVSNLSDPTEDQDAATKAWVLNNGSTYADQAEANVIATEAERVAAEVAKDAAEAAQLASETAYSLFFQSYLGAFSTPPTARADLSALQNGDRYYDTDDGFTYVYDLAGTTWVSAGAANTADSVVFTPVGNVSAVNIQTAIQELDTEKEPADATILKDADIGGSVQAKTGALDSIISGITLADWTITDTAGTLKIAKNGVVLITISATGVLSAAGNVIGEETL